MVFLDMRGTRAFERLWKLIVWLMMLGYKDSRKSKQERSRELSPVGTATKLDELVIVWVQYLRWPGEKNVGKPSTILVGMLSSILIETARLFRHCTPYFIGLRCGCRVPHVFTSILVWGLLEKTKTSSRNLSWWLQRDPHLVHI